MKTRTRTVITTCIAFLAVGIIASTAFSRPHGKHGKADGFHLPIELIKQLSKEQIGKLKSLHVDLKKQLLPLKAEVQVKHLEIKELWDADTLDEDAILSKSDEVFETEKQIHQATTRHHLEVAKLLTKEQRAEREELIESRNPKKNRHGKRRGFRDMQYDGDDHDRKRMRHGKSRISRDMRRDKDDELSREEHREEHHDPHRISREEIIERFDEDGDGDLSREERENAAEWLSEEKD